MNNYKVVNML